jgi:hypothetical protein
MKQIAAILIALLSVTALSQDGILVPHASSKTFVEEDLLFAYQDIQDVILSVAYLATIQGEYIMELTIDNKSTDTLRFDPAKIYIFRYRNDTALEEQKLYAAIDPDIMADSLNLQANLSKKKKNRSIAASILLSAGLLTAEIAGYNGNLSYEALEILRFTHDIAQMGLDFSRHMNADELAEIYHNSQYWSQQVLGPVTIYPGMYKTGNLHFKIPTSNCYKIYMPVGDRLYRFMFVQAED